MKALIATLLVLVGSSAQAFVCTLTPQGALKYSQITIGTCQGHPSDMCVEGVLRQTGSAIVDQVKARPDLCSALVCHMAGANVDVGLYYYQTGNKAYVYNHGTQKVLATCE